MRRRLRLVLFALFALTGFSALTLQVVWQRVISLHAGVDLSSTTTVVSAFLAGLGVGSLLGGAIADRLGPRRSLLAFAVSNAGIGAFAWISVWLFYDVYRSVASEVEGALAGFGFHFVLLLVPATLMGLSLPLLSRAVVARAQDAGPLVGRLYSVNTIGAGIGAATSGWFLVGTLGFVGTARVAGALNLLTAGLVLTLARWARSTGVGHPAPASAPAPSPPATGARWRPWVVLYGLTGAVALGLEIVFFRVVDALMRSNAYTFGHLLSLYLVVLGAGTAVGSRLVRRADRPDRWFLALQFGVGVAALAGILVLVEVPGRIGLGAPLERQFAIDGYNLGGYRFDSVQELARLLFVHLGGPLLIMGLPVFAMGASFPFVEALVAERVEVLGRRTGVLLFANTFGNVAGSLLVGFVLIGLLGTAGTLRLLAALLLLPGLAVAASAASLRRRVALTVGAVSVLGSALAAFPSNARLWAYLHSAPRSEFTLAEDRACVNALKKLEGQDVLFINAASQNGYPFDDFHVLIGLLPALMHPDPRQALAVGLGIGATPYGMSRDPRVSRLAVVEICGGEVELQRVLDRRGAMESGMLLRDPRVGIHVGDGRRHLISSEGGLDVVTVDVVRPQSSSSGSLYSVEFYELVRDRIDAEGLVAQWIPTTRALNSVTEVFPHVVSFTVESYNRSRFFVASRSPIRFDREAVLARFEGLHPDSAFSPGQARSIALFLSTTEPSVIADGSMPTRVAEGDLNRDLVPRDEYFLNNPGNVKPRGS